MKLRLSSGKLIKTLALYSLQLNSSGKEPVAAG